MMNPHIGQLGKFLLSHTLSANSVLEIGAGNNPLAHLFFDNKIISHVDKEIELNGFNKEDFLKTERYLNC